MEKELSEQEKDLLYLLQMKVWMVLLKSLEDSNVLTKSITESLKYEIKKQEGQFLPAMLAPLAVSLVQAVISSEVKSISRQVSFWETIYLE